MTIKDIPNWEVEQQRITVFRFPGTEINSIELWKTVTNCEPEEITQKPAIGMTKIEGTFENSKYYLNVENERIDFIIGALPLVPFSMENLDFPTIGKINEVFPKFNSLANLLLNHVHGILRIGYGMVLLEKAESRELCYQRLAKSLPSIKFDIEKSSEFFFQINRPLPSKILEHSNINRMSKWNSVRLTTKLFSESGPIISQAKAPSSEAARLELDISTPLNRTDELPRKIIGELLNEISNFGMDIALNGDK